MTSGINFIAVALLGCLAGASGNLSDSISIPSLFSDGKTFIYDYSGEVKAALLDPDEIDSEYVIKGNFYITRYSSDLLLVTLQNTSIGLKNGRSADFEDDASYEPISEAAKILEEPVLFHYSESGELKGVQFSQKELAWSENIKFAWASTMQLTWNAFLESPKKFQGYIATEKTIYGKCPTSYIVDAKNLGINKTPAVFVEKFYSPSECSNFNSQGSDYESLSNSANYKTYELKNKDDNEFELQKIKSIGQFFFSPLLNENVTFIIYSDTTWELKEVVSSSEIALPIVNFTTSPLIFDWTYKPSKLNDSTGGRHVVNQNYLVTETQQMLISAVNFIEEYQKLDLNWEQGKMINKILVNLYQADILSLEKIFYSFQNISSQTEYDALEIYLGILPHVGTAASCSFVLNLSKSDFISDFKKIEFFLKFPLYVRGSYEDILTKMESIIFDNESLSPEIRKSAILAFATLVSRNNNAACIEKYLKVLYDHLISAIDYADQQVYMSAIGNIQHGAIYKYLAPIVMGEVQIFPYPNKIRLLAMWAIQVPLKSNYFLGYNLFAPIMTDYTLPLSLRVSAYEYLIYNAQSMADVLRIHWFMTNENSKHFYHYYCNTIQNLALSSSTNDQLKEYAIKIWGLIGSPAETSKNLSTSQIHDEVNVHGNGFKYRFSILYNEEKNILEQFYAGLTFFEGHKIVSNWGFFLNVGGIDNLMRLLNIDTIGLKDTINQAFIFELIKKVPAALAAMPDSQIEMILLYKERSVMSNYYNATSLKKLKNDVENVLKFYETSSNVAILNILKQVSSSYHVYYHNLNEQIFINDMGIPFTLHGYSPAVYALKVSRNELEEDYSSMETEIHAKIWLTRINGVSVYNPCIDGWHFAAQTTIVVAHASLGSNVHINPVLDFFKMAHPKYWDITFTGADILIIKKSSAAIRYFKNDNLSPNSNYNLEAIETKDPNTPKNLTIARNHNNEFKWEITSSDCENEAGVTPNDKWIESWQNEYYELNLIPQELNNCKKFFKIKPIHKITPFRFL